MNREEKRIEDVLKQYEAALNASNTDAVLDLYTEDGVFMPQHFPSSVGSVAVRQAYDGVFSAIHLSIKFEVVEIHQVAAHWAFARTNSTGTVKVHANGHSGPESNQELFVLQNVADQWKIARYCFSTTNPPRS